MAKRLTTEKLWAAVDAEDFKDADLMGRVMSHAFAEEMRQMRQYEIDNIPTAFRELIAEAAARWAKLIRTGLIVDFNKAQSDLVLACDLFEWYLAWLGKNHAGEGG